MAGEAPDLSGILSSILQNPAALSAMTGLLGGLRRSEGDAPVPATAAEQEREASASGGESIPALSLAPPPHNGGRHREREILLAALMPYLSPQRRRALEGASKILEVLELFEKRK